MGTSVSRRGLVCHYCQTLPGTTNDHIIPKAFGGPMHFWNLQPACTTCNLAKTDTWPTCECEKCQAAILTFCANPDLVFKAVTLLKKRRSAIDHHIDNILTIRVPMLEKKRDFVDDQLFQVLTGVHEASIVEP